MSWKNDALMLGGLAVGAYALITYVFPKSANALNTAVVGAIGTAGTAIGTGAGNIVVSAGTPVIQTFNPFNPHAVQNEPLFQAGYNVGSWVRQNPWLGQGSWIYSLTGGLI